MNIQLVLLGYALAKFSFTSTKHQRGTPGTDDPKQYPALAAPRLITGDISSSKDHLPTYR